MSIARQVVVKGIDGADVARQLIEKLDAPDLVLALVFHEWQLDPSAIASAMQRGLPHAIVAGCTTTGAIGPGVGNASAIGLYGDWIRVGVGMAAEVSKLPITRSRNAVHAAAQMLGTTPEQLDPARHVAVALLDGTCGHEEAFCVGSAAAAPQIRIVGGSAGSEIGSGRRAVVWARGEALSDAGLVLLLDSQLPCHTLRSSHLEPTPLRTVVTAASGRRLEELDGKPATKRLAELVAKLGDTLSPMPTHGLARFVEGIPYVRSILSFDDAHVLLRTAVEPGQVLQLMRPGDLVGITHRDLAIAAETVGGIGAMIAFSCVARHWDAAQRGIEHELAAEYAAYPSVGLQTFSEQSGMLLVNHTLTGLAIGVPGGR